MSNPIRIVGIGRTAVGRLGMSTTELSRIALDNALTNAGMHSHNIQGIVAIPSLSHPHFMQAHYFATVYGMIYTNDKMVLRTIDTGGAGPISAIATAVNMIKMDWCQTVAIIGSDAVLSLNNTEFLQRANGSVDGCNLPSPAIPHGYDLYAQYQMKKYGITREQLAMVPVLMSHMSSKHPDALCQIPYTLTQVLESQRVAPVTNILECARRADGAAAIILSSEKYYSQTFSNEKLDHTKPVIISVGEASGPLYPPSSIDNITSTMLVSCEHAATSAYKSAQLGPSDIDFFGLYDCFPICFIRAIEAVGLCPRGEGGNYIQQHYNAMEQRRIQGHTDVLPVTSFPINTHGGLQCFGAPWEVPAMYNLIEAVQQISGTCRKQRQVLPYPKRALVYGNGGIFSASAVAIIGNGEY